MPNPKVQIRKVLNDRELAVANLILNGNYSKNKVFIAISEYDEIIACGVLNIKSTSNQIDKIVIAHGFENLGYEDLMMQFEV